MKILDHISRCRDFHIEGYAIFLFILALRFYWVIPIFFIYLYYLRKKISWYFIWAICLIILVQYVFISFRDVPKTIKSQVYITHVDQTPNYDIVTIKYHMMKFRFYAQKDQYQRNNLIFLDAKVNQFKSRTIFFGFDLKTYFMSQGVMGELDINEIEFIKSNFSFNGLKDIIDERTDHLKSKDYIKAFIFGEKSIPIEERQTYQSLGILFLFSVSGLHLYGLNILVKKKMFYFNLSQKTQKIIILSIYLLFLYLYNFSLTILRISLLYVFHWINERFYLKYTHLDLIQVTFLCLVIINPYLMYDQGVLIVYLILNFLVLLNPILHGENHWIKRFKMSGLIQLIILPFRLTANLVIIMISPLIILFLSGPAFLFAILTLITTKLDFYYMNMMEWFFLMIKRVSDYGFHFFLPALSPIKIMLYFFIIIVCFYMKKSIYKVLGIIILCFMIFMPSLKPYESKVKVMMLDVGQGDSFYFESRNCKMMIDTYQGSLDFLQNRGIYTLDYLFLTHSDTDHIKEAVDITKYLEVKKIAISPYETYPGLYGKLFPLKSDDSFTCGVFDIHVLGPIKSYDHNNDNSLVLKIKIHDKTFLFTGDIESDAEENLIQKYGVSLRSDVVKISHHGSVTSTSESFIKLLTPKIALISVGTQNRFGFPDEVVLDRLRRHHVEIYRTDIMGTVILTYDENKRKWTVHLPFEDDF